MPLASRILGFVPPVSMDTVHSLTFPVCPFRFEMFSRLVVVKMWITFPLTAANRWPPLLKEHCQEIQQKSKSERKQWAVQLVVTVKISFSQRVQAETLCGSGIKRVRLGPRIGWQFRYFHYSCSSYWPRCWHCHAHHHETAWIRVEHSHCLKKKVQSGEAIPEMTVLFPQVISGNLMGCLLTLTVEAHIPWLLPVSNLAFPAVTLNLR